MFMFVLERIFRNFYSHVVVVGDADVTMFNRMRAVDKRRRHCVTRRDVVSVDVAI